MKSAIQSVVLALALSVSAAPVDRSSSKSSDSGVGKHSGSGAGSRSGLPSFFGDDPNYKGPSHDAEDREGSSPSAYKPPTGFNSTTTSPSYNSTTTSPSLTTSTSTSGHLDKRINLPSRLVTPDFKNYISKDGYTMWGMQNPVCSDVTLIFARGTTEKGNMGTCVGPELAEALRDEIPSLSVQGVDYPADSEGNTKYGASGGPYMAMLAREARKACPDTKIVLAGYSQGARVIYGALEKSYNPVDGKEIAAVVAFGDPLNGKLDYKNVDRDDVLEVCGKSDDRCQDGKVDMEIDGGHISYGSSAKKVAKWIKKTVG